MYNFNEGINKQKHNQDFTNNFTDGDKSFSDHNLRCQEQVLNSDKQNVRSRFVEPSNTSFASYSNVPSQYSVPPPPCPPFHLIEQANFHTTHYPPDLGNYLQQMPQVPVPHVLQFQNIIPFRDGSGISHPAPNTISQECTNELSISSSKTEYYGSVSLDDDGNSKMWIHNWMKRNRKVNDDIKEEETTDSTDVKIYEVKDKVELLTMLLIKLENLTKSLSITHKSLHDDQWKQRCNEIEETKKAISGLLSALNNRKMLLHIRYKLKKRKQKRDRQKRKREEWKNFKIEGNVKRQKLHRSIDQWLENMKDNVERSRRDEEMKREADSVLADVTRKKNEAKRQISLLSALLKLRQARVTAQLAMGRNISEQQTEAFCDVIERLKSLWENQLKGYLLEEQGLKVMLNEAAIEEKNSEALKKKEAVREWEKCLFGCENRHNKFQPHDLNELIAVRNQWDQFVVNEGTIMSSSIPPGWVIPVKPCDITWKKCLKYND